MRKTYGFREQVPGEGEGPPLPLSLSSLSCLPFPGPSGLKFFSRALPSQVPSLALEFSALAASQSGPAEEPQSAGRGAAVGGTV